MLTNIQKFLVELDSMSPQITSCIKNMKMLKDCLIELDSFIEMYEIKSAIISQINLLILITIRHKFIPELAVKDRFEGHSLHGIIFGPPGVGKTSVGKIIAKIYSAIGILNNSQGSSPKSAIQNNPKIQYNCYQSISLANEIKEIASSLQDSPSIQEDITRIQLIAENISEKCIDIQDAVSSNKSPNSPSSDRSPGNSESDVVVASREDLISGYQGKTAEKTTNFLKANFGKLVIIDEAYSLMNGSHDEYGFEALNCISRFMSDHADKIVIYLLGYEHSIKEGIFKSQPGLESRIGKTFIIKPYTPKGLSKIFLKQLSDYKWKISEDYNIEEFFTKNYKYFKGYGRDTHSLVLFCKEEFTERTRQQKIDFDLIIDSTITGEMVEAAFKKYASHRDLESAAHLSYML